MLTQNSVTNHTTLHAIVYSRDEVELATLTNRRPISLEDDHKI